MLGRSVWTTGGDRRDKAIIEIEDVDYVWGRLIDVGGER
jgi:hypothetical protein